MESLTRGFGSCVEEFLEVLSRSRVAVLGGIGIRGAAREGGRSMERKLLEVVGS